MDSQDCEAVNPKLLDKIEALFGNESGEWCMTSNPQLNGRSPNRAVLEGDEMEVERIIDQLESGAFI